MQLVIFDPEKFRTLYPAYRDEVKYPDELLQMYFDSASMFVGNTPNDIRYPYNPDKGVFEREIFIFLAMCHLLTLEANADTGAPVGRISSASQGSVSTSFDLLKTNSYLGDWWNQTQCGARYWVLTMKYRIGARINAGNTFHPWG